MRIVEVNPVDLLSVQLTPATTQSFGPEHAIADWMASPDEKAPGLQVAPSFDDQRTPGTPLELVPSTTHFVADGQRTSCPFSSLEGNVARRLHLGDDASEATAVEGRPSGSLGPCLGGAAGEPPSSASNNPAMSPATVSTLMATIAKRRKRARRFASLSRTSMSGPLEGATSGIRVIVMGSTSMLGRMVLSGTV
jgi:hypothetical protein